MKGILSIFLSAILLTSLSACSGAGTSADLTPDQIQKKLQEFAEHIPKTEINDVSLSQSADGESAEYTASFDLTWKEQSGRYAAERNLNQYSRRLAVNVLRNTPSVSTFDVKWTIPYHAENEVAMAYTFERRKDVMWQTDLYDRFTDGSFGADAFLEDPQDMGSPMPPGTAVVAAMTPQDAQEALSGPASTVIRLSDGTSKQMTSAAITQSPAPPIPAQQPDPQSDTATPQTPAEAEAPAQQAEQQSQQPPQQAASQSQQQPQQANQQSQQPPQQAASVPQQQTQSTTQSNSSQTAKTQSPAQSNPSQAAQATQSANSNSAKTANTSSPTSGGGGQGNADKFNTYNIPEQQQTSDKYVLNLHTKKFHIPTCGEVKKIKPDNYSTSNATAAEIRNQGFDPCKKCNPR